MFAVLFVVGTFNPVLIPLKENFGLGRTLGCLDVRCLDPVDDLDFSVVHRSIRIIEAHTHVSFLKVFFQVDEVMLVSLE